MVRSKTPEPAPQGLSQQQQQHRPRLIDFRTFCEEYAKCGERTGHRIRAAGKGPPEIHIAGSARILIDEDDAAAWLLSWRKPALTPEPPRNPGRPKKR